MKDSHVSGLAAPLPPKDDDTRADDRPVRVELGLYGSRRLGGVDSKEVAMTLPTEGTDPELHAGEPDEQWVREYERRRDALEYAIAERERQRSTSGSIEDAKRERVNAERVAPARAALNAHVVGLTAERDAYRLDVDLLREGSRIMEAEKQRLAAQRDALREALKSWKCPKCEGEGDQYGAFGKPEPCDVCHGSGIEPFAFRVLNPEGADG